MTTANQKVVREDLRFASGEAQCAAWLYRPAGVDNPPVVVLGHGLGGTREMRLDAFAERFAANGIAALAFTYRYFGDSGGKPRQLMSVARQLEDWEAALNFVKDRTDLDGSRIGVWGSSFGGGHAITIASRHPELRAAVSQCPFTYGRASAGALGIKATLKLIPLVVRDLVARLLDRPPVYVPVAAAPGELGLMNAPDALSGVRKMTPHGVDFVNYVTARVVPEITAYRPGLAASAVRMPLLVCVSNTDTVTPPEKTIAQMQKAPQAEIRRYDAGHFDFYVGEPFEELVSDQTDFLVRHLLTQR